MRIGVISDTHIPAVGRNLPRQIWKAFDGVDLILHAGDIYTTMALDELETIAPVLAIDGGGVDANLGDPRVAHKRYFQLGGLNIGMVHMLVLPGIRSDVVHGSIEKEFDRSFNLTEVTTKIFGGPVDVLVYGDSHIETLERHEDILFLNPGSPTLPKQMMRLGTVAVMEINGGGATARIIDLKEL